MNTKTRLIAAIAAVIATTSAFAAPIDNSNNTVSVSYSAEFTRADLQTEVGAKAAYARLRSLARRVCTDGEASRSVAMFETQECAAKALESAVKELGSPAVEQLHVAKLN
ncbi:MAG: UrcA family protein [Steroidobacteraceae bacterium]